MANKINVLECGPRDGWQNLKQMLTFEQKLDLIDRLFDAGVTQMEVTSFVSPKAIPQMADAADLAKACIEKYPNAVLYALAPNFRGVENAFNAGIRNISYVISVSESHNKANIRRTHEESLEELQKIMDTYPQMNICVALATSFGCRLRASRRSRRWSTLPSASTTWASVPSAWPTRSASPTRVSA